MIKNKNDKIAFEVICDRSGNSEMKERIQNLFHSNYFISILREEDETVTINKPQKLMPIKSKLTSAIAGPMSKHFAEDLYERLKNPRSRSKEEVAIRLSDYSKGIERIARIQCKQNSINWQEYWSFLHDYVDLASDKGLKKLEACLKESYLNRFFHSISKKFKKQNKEREVDINEVCEKLADLNVEDDEQYDEANDQLNDEQYEIYYTAPSTPFEEESFYLNG